MKLLLSALAMLALAACSSTDSNIGRTPMVHRVAVSRAGTIASDQGSSFGSEVGERVLKRGVSAALGAVRLGWAGELIDLAGGVRAPSKKKAGVSQSFRQQCMLGGTDPIAATAQALERRIRRDRIYTLDSQNPEATIVLTLVSADMQSVDSIGLSAQPSLTVRASLIDRKGTVLWQRVATGKGSPHAWHDYGERSSLFRTELAAAADAVAAGLSAQLSRGR